MKKPVHPAFALFQQMFAEAAADPDQPYAPENYVQDDTFQKALARERIDHPSNPVEYWRWRDEIGLQAFISKLIRTEHRRKGTKPDPMTAGAARLHRHLKREGLLE